jgi:hypothetical protein
MASTSALQSSRTGHLVEPDAEQVGGLVERGVGALGHDHLGLGDAALGPAALAGRLHPAQDRLGAAAGEEPGRGVGPWSRSAVQPTTSDWMAPSDRNAMVFSAFSCRYSTAARSATSCTLGPPSNTNPKVRPSRQRTSPACLASRSAMTSSTGRPCCGGSCHDGSGPHPWSRRRRRGRSAPVSMIVDARACSPRTSWAGGSGRRGSGPAEPACCIGLAIAGVIAGSSATPRRRRSSRPLHPGVGRHLRLRTAPAGPGVGPPGRLGLRGRQDRVVRGHGPHGRRVPVARRRRGRSPWPPCSASSW